MAAYQCVKGHDSTEPDFCSVCGAKVQAAASPDNATQYCPDCGAARDASGGVYCEICGFNFNTGAHGELKPVAETPVVTAPPPVIQPAWEVVVTVDPSLKGAESPETPPTFEPVTIRLASESNLIGRKSDKRGVFPEVALDFDDAVSHRHALLNKTPDGGLVLRDIGSSNGTMLNGADLPPLTDTPLKDGDQVTVGHWTRLSVKAPQ